MESELFNCVLSKPLHVLYQLLPPVNEIGYNLPSTDNNVIRKNCLGPEWMFTSGISVHLYVLYLYASRYGLRLSVLNNETT